MRTEDILDRLEDAFFEQDYETFLEIKESLQRNNLLKIPLIMEYNFDNFEEMKKEYNLISEVLFG